MRKRMIDQSMPSGTSEEEPAWLDLEHSALVEVTSEHELHPIESSLLLRPGTGWRASSEGQQTIRLLFDKPQRIKRIHLVFQETEEARTQEFRLRWSPDGRTFKEVARQQYNFSPAGATSEVEDFNVELGAVAVLELTIIPDISGGGYASLSELRLA